MSPFERAWALIKTDFGVRQSRDSGSGVHRFELDEDVADEVWDEEFETTPVEHILQDAARQTYDEGFGRTTWDPENPERILRLLEFWSNETGPYFHSDDPMIEIAKKILNDTRQRIAAATQGMGGA